MYSTIEAGSVHLFGTPREVHPIVLVVKPIFNFLCSVLWTRARVCDRC